MKCPACKEVNLSMTARQGVEIDYCPQYRGIWLDRGELDRLIERADPPAPEPARDRGPERHRPRVSGRALSEAAQVPARGTLRFLNALPCGGPR
jgi:Zn-finger nucleic acid-binding protein